MRLIPLFALLMVLSSTIVSAQTFNSAGNFNVAGNWSTNAVPGGTGTDISVSANMTVSDTRTIGNVTVANNTDVTVSGTFNVGAVGTARNLTFSNSGTLTVSGNLYVYGNLVVNNSLTLNITGTMIVYGDVQMVNGGALSVSGAGSLQVGGNLTGGNNTVITTTGTPGGTINVTGAINIGGGNSNINEQSGSINAGSCSCGSCSTSGCSTVTPVILVDFEANVDNGVVRLDWATSMEENFKHFVVQRASEGVDFSDIGVVEGKNPESKALITPYDFTDYTPLLGYNFYRLKAIDLDNTFEIFSTKAVRVLGDRALTVYPNPSDGSVISFSTNFNASEKDQVRVINTFGKVIYAGVVSGNSHSFKPANALSAGVYYIQYIGESHNQTFRLLVNK